MIGSKIDEFDRPLPGTGKARGAESVWSSKIAASADVAVAAFDARWMPEIAAPSSDPLDAIVAPNWGLVTPDANGKVYVYFAEAGEGFGEGPSFGWSAFEKAQAMLALAEFEKILGFTYEITTNANQADFRLIAGNGDGSLGYFFPITGSAKDGIGNFNVGTGPDAGYWGNGAQTSLLKGGYSWVTLIHEFGHGHGLAHPHDTGGGSNRLRGVTSAFDDYGDFDLNQAVFTVMSYNDAWPLHPNGGSPYSLATSGYGWNGTLSALDIAALQQRYGIVNPWATGNTVYRLQDVNAAGTYYETIWDTGGIDRIRYSGSRDAVIDLTAATLDYSPTGGGVVSFVAGIKGGFTIANMVVIENATSGAGDDSLTGNAAANLLVSRAGADTLSGAIGDDTLRGGDGNDTLLGGGGDDYLVGGAGLDRVQGGSGGDILFDKQGGDTLEGGGGDDKYVVFTATSVIIETSGGGIDAIRAKAGFALPAHVENLTMLGGLDLSATGNGLANDMTGNSGANAIAGGTGHDFLAGRAGSDTLSGQGGDDTLRGDRGADSLNGGGGEDVLFGDSGLDTLTGGAGADVFTFLDDSQFDTVTDFEDGTDLIRLSDYRQENGGNKLTFDQLLVTQQGADTRIQLDLDRDGIADAIDLDGDGSGDGWSVTLLDTSAGTITAADFVF